MYEVAARQCERLREHLNESMCNTRLSQYPMWDSARGSMWHHSTADLWSATTYKLTADDYSLHPIHGPG